MADKKLAQIAVHVSDDVKRLVTRLADTDGVTVSEYVHSLLMREISSKRALMVSLTEAFGSCEGTDSSGGRP